MTPEDGQRVREIARKEIAAAIEAERERASQILKSLSPPPGALQRRIFGDQEK